MSEKSDTIKKFARELDDLMRKYSMCVYQNGSSRIELRHRPSGDNASWCYFKLTQDLNTFELSFANVRSPDVLVWAYEGEI